MEVIVLAIGIDMSKASFDTAVQFNGKYQNKYFSNDLKGFKAFLKWLKPIKQDKVFCKLGLECNYFCSCSTLFSALCSLGLFMQLVMRLQSHLCLY